MWFVFLKEVFVESNKVKKLIGEKEMEKTKGRKEVNAQMFIVD